MNTYTANTTWSDGWWVIQLEEEPAIITQTRTLDEIPAMVKDALTLFPELEADPDNATINIAFDPTPGDTTARVREVLEGLKAGLRAEGMSPEDIAHLLYALANQPTQQLPAAS